MKKKILISTGGTGGHVIPALQLYNHLKNSFDVMIYTDLSVLTSTTTFGVFSGGDGAGGIEVTWGTHGNFVGGGTADCYPFCAGAFGGSGNWYKSK